jgi:hypothetical protein
MAEMKLARIMGVVAVFLAIFVYGHVISVRVDASAKASGNPANV